MAKKKTRTKSEAQRAVFAAVDRAEAIALNSYSADAMGEPPPGLYAVITREGAGLIIRRSAHHYSLSSPIEFEHRTLEGQQINPNIIEHWHPIPEFPSIAEHKLVVKG